MPSSLSPTFIRASGTERVTHVSKGAMTPTTNGSELATNNMNARERFTYWRCPRPIDSANWHLGCEGRDRSRHCGPECRPCNTATAAQRGR